MGVSYNNNRSYCIYVYIRMIIMAFPIYIGSQVILIIRTFT